MIHAEYTQRQKWFVLVVRQFKIEQFLFDYKTKIGEKNANRVWSFDCLCKHSANAHDILLGFKTCSFDVEFLFGLSD